MHTPEREIRLQKNPHSRAFRTFHADDARPFTERAPLGALTNAVAKTGLAFRDPDRFPALASILIHQDILDQQQRDHADKDFYAYVVVPAETEIPEGWYAREITHGGKKGLCIISAVPPELHAGMAALRAEGDAEGVAELSITLEDAAGAEETSAR